MGEGMNKTKALHTLKMYNAYRRGAINQNRLDDEEITPYSIGEAIECAIESFELTLELGEPKADKVYNVKARR